MNLEERVTRVLVPLVERITPPNRGNPAKTRELAEVWAHAAMREVLDYVSQMAAAQSWNSQTGNLRHNALMDLWEDMCQPADGAPSAVSTETSSSTRPPEHVSAPPVSAAVAGRMLADNAC